MKTGGKDHHRRTKIYVDAKNIAGIIYVTERTEDGQLEIKTARAPYVAFIEDEYGPYRSITGVKLQRRTFKKRKDLLEFKDQYKKRVWESDVNPTFRYLEDAYPDDNKLPDLHISILDIEVDRDQARGYAPPNNPFCPIISFTIYHKWCKQAITIAIPPPNLSYEKATRLVTDETHPDGYGRLGEEEGYFLVRDETVLLDIFLKLIEDTDIISGWNSEFYDIPYIINRARVVIGGEDPGVIAEEKEFLPTDESQEYLLQLSVFDVLPDTSDVEMYGRRERVYHLLGRRHVDYLAFYKKFVKAELHSFSLDAILQHEVGQTKVKFDGSIDEFYRREFRRFLAYNRQDVMGLSAIDDKRRLINMANQMIHMSGVTMDKAIGSVAIIEQAILRELHRERREIAWDRVEHQPDKYVPGAFVVDPRAGKYGWGGSYDVNSLYPTMIRLLNISPETMIGQLDLSRSTKMLNDYVDNALNIPKEMRDPNDEKNSYRNTRKEDGIAKAYTQAWHQFTGALEYHDVIEGSLQPVKLVTPDKVITMTGREMRELIIKSNWCITANGTVFDLSREGIIPYCLTKWYNERAEYRDKGKDFEKQAEKADKAEAQELLRMAELYDLIQDAKKRFLNSTYGAYLNRFFRFYDSRCGRSVTLSGRVVVKHMCRKACELLGGDYDFDRVVLLGGDTDSTYINYEGFLDREGIEKNLENVIMVGEWVGDEINKSFSSYLSEQFLVPPDRCNIVQVKRETVFDRAIFKDKKKRYAMHVLDKENKRVQKGNKDELKIVGMEVKRSDTPRHIQDFLQECLRLVLVEGYEEEELRAYVEEYRAKFREMESWQRGSPVRLHNLEVTNDKLDRFADAQEDHDFSAKKPLAYYAVMAARNTNILMQKFRENRWESLKDGDKVEILSLQQGNEYRMDAVALRVGEEYVPKWFQSLPFDDNAHEQKLIDQKLLNVFGGLGWDFEPRDHSGFDIFI